MDRVAIFVDAGYLFAQGSVALAGSKRSRADVALNEAAAVSELIRFGLERDPGSSLLRIYWYDGLGGRETAEQKRIAECENVKLRLGVINSSGQQKGVDSLIVTDLVELARTNAISTAVLLSGDEDVRIGVEIAQKYGVRVHLLGIVPSRGSQSPLLLREADTTTEWDATVVRTFLAVLPAAASLPTSPTPISAATLSSTGATMRTPAAATASSETVRSTTLEQQLEKVAEDFVLTVRGVDVAQVIADWDARRGLERVMDGRLLAAARTEINRELDVKEKRILRRSAVDALRKFQP